MDTAESLGGAVPALRHTRHESGGQRRDQHRGQHRGQRVGKNLTAPTIPRVRTPEARQETTFAYASGALYLPSTLTYTYPEVITTLTPPWLFYRISRKPLSRGPDVGSNHSSRKRLATIK